MTNRHRLSIALGLIGSVALGSGCVQIPPALTGPQGDPGPQGPPGPPGPNDVTDNLTMVNSTATAGNILKGGVPFIHNFGVNNTFLGRNAGNLTMSGASNTASGTGALGGNTTGSNNTASGDSALSSNATGSNNTASGVEALFNNTVGVHNTASGTQALFSNTTGNDNTATGAAALHSNTAGHANTATGVNALFSNLDGRDNTATGVNALVNNTTGVSNTAIGVNALLSNTTGPGNTAIGVTADVSVGNLFNATAIGFGAIVNASNKIRLGNGAVTVIEGQVGFTASSDRNQKENFQPVEGEEVLTKIRGLSLTSWNFIGHNPKQFRHYGPVAQDFFAAFGQDGIGKIGTPTTITSTDMDGILMIAAQALEKRTVEQREEIHTLRAEQTKAMDALRAENAELKARLEALERMFVSYALTKAE